MKLVWSGPIMADGIIGECGQRERGHGELRIRWQGDQGHCLSPSLCAFTCEGTCTCAPSAETVDIGYCSLPHSLNTGYHFELGVSLLLAKLTASKHQWSFGMWCLPSVLDYGCTCCIWVLGIPRPRFSGLHSNCSYP